MAELRCEGVAKSYGTRAVLRGLDLVVLEGTLTAVLGASGSGKTTMLRVIMGLVEADAGTIVVGGSLVADGRRLNVRTDKRSIGYVAQEGALFPHITVAQNIGFGLARSERKQRMRVAETLQLVGLDDSYGARPPQELSGGEQRRVALARALAPRPRLVLLDEPFSGLDAALRADTREAVMHALAQEGATAVLVTHDQAEALSMGREVAVLREGLLVQHATPTALYRQPVDFGVARFVGEAVLLAGHASSGRVTCALGDLNVREPVLEREVEVMIRPEQIELTKEPAAEDGVVLARVIDHTYYGPDTVIRLALESDPSAIVRSKTFARSIPVAGELVALAVHGPVVVYPRQRSRAETVLNGEVAKSTRTIGKGEE
ncbi:MAG TPA: ABC transporter ATP-binding protein [Solirubrobacteraceae bacterium]|nr:ABC transporter ATP-binding protein [Solirubrobacteraceae bacterium]